VGTGKSGVRCGGDSKATVHCLYFFDTPFPSTQKNTKCWCGYNGFISMEIINNIAACLHNKIIFSWVRLNTIAFVHSVLFGVKKKKHRFDMTLRIRHVLVMIILFDQPNL